MPSPNHTNGPSSRILRFRDRNPRRNLPESVATKRREANFVGAFGRALMEENQRCYAGNGIEVNGYGIPDLVWVSWRKRPDRDEGMGLEVRRENAPPPRLRLTAFEMKLRDWRSGLVQAYRYSYFADRAVLVLPTPLAKQLAEDLSRFKNAGIGLWGFDAASGVITRLSTPRSSGRVNHDLKDKIANRFLGRLNSQSSA